MQNSHPLHLHHSQCARRADSLHHGWHCASRVSPFLPAPMDWHVAAGSARGGAVALVALGVARGSRRSVGVGAMVTLVAVAVAVVVAVAVAVAVAARHLR